MQTKQDQFFTFAAMLSFFTSKPFLKDLLAGSYIDIHSHLLPGIDDGAKTIKKTIKLAKAFQELGVSQYITTPHINHYVWNNSETDIQEKQKETKLLLEKENISMPFTAAAEYFMDDWFENHLKEGKLLTLKDNYILVEISYLSAPLNLYKMIFDIQLAGYKPVLAHPERYLYFHKNFKEYENLKKAGCFFQLNLLAVMGYYGSEITKMAELLLKKEMYDFTGTDVHHSKHIEALNQRIKISETSNLKEVIANNQFFKF